MPASAPPVTCANCGNHFEGAFCNQCGEKVLVNEAPSFRDFLRAFRAGGIIRKNKFLHTLWLVVTRPGFVSAEFARGRTVRYASLGSVFFMLNLVYFFFPVIQLFNASLKTQLLGLQRDYIKTIIARKMISMNVDIHAFGLLYNAHTTSLAKLMVMVFVVLASFPLYLLYYKRNQRFPNHLNYSLELACFNLFINAIVLTLFVKIFGVGKYLDELVLTGIFVSTNLYFLLRSGAIHFQEKGLSLVLKSILMILFLKIALEAYRAILFFVTIWTL